MKKNNLSQTRVYEKITYVMVKSPLQTYSKLRKKLVRSAAFR